MGKKASVPLFNPSRSGSEHSDRTKRPSIETARTRLGGRVTNADVPVPSLPPGTIVSFASFHRRGGSGESEAKRTLGVVVFASAAEVHVLLDGIHLRRLPPADLERVPSDRGDAGIELEKLAADARVFGNLVEGEAVRYADEAGNLVDGKVVEKCRWGALILRDEGAIVAVGFRKLWPSSSHGTA